MLPLRQLEQRQVEQQQLEQPPLEQRQLEPNYCSQPKKMLPPELERVLEQGLL